MCCSKGGKEKTRERRVTHRAEHHNTTAFPLKKQKNNNNKHTNIQTLHTDLFIGSFLALWVFLFRYTKVIFIGLYWQATSHDHETRETPKRDDLWEAVFPTNLTNLDFFLKKCIKVGGGAHTMETLKVKQNERKRGKMERRTTERWVLQRITEFLMGGGGDDSALMHWKNKKQQNSSSTRLLHKGLLGKKGCIFIF